MNMLQICEPQIRLLKRFTTIHAVSGLGGPEVTHLTGVLEVTGSIPCPGKDFMFDFLF